MAALLGVGVSMCCGIEACKTRKSNGQAEPKDSVVCAGMLIDIIMFVGFVVVGSVAAANKIPGLARTVGYGFLGGAGAIVTIYALILYPFTG